MTTPAEPLQGIYAVHCENCGALAYSSDAAPPADPTARVQAFASEHCPRGGAPLCPYVPNEQQARREARPYRLWQLIRDVRDLSDRLTPIAEGAETAHQELHDANAELSARIEQVGARLEQVGAACDALAVQVRALADRLANTERIGP